MAKIVIDDVLLKEPSLYVPRMQPICPVNLIKQKNSLAEKLSRLVIFNSHYTEPDPYNGIFDLVSKSRHAAVLGSTGNIAVRSDIGGMGFQRISTDTTNIAWDFDDGYSDLDVLPHSAFVVFSFSEWFGSSVVFSFFSIKNTIKNCGIRFLGSNPNVAYAVSPSETAFTKPIGLGEIHCAAWSGVDGNFRFAHNGGITATASDVTYWSPSNMIHINSYDGLPSGLTIYAYGGFKDVFLSDAELISITNDPYQFVEPA